MNTVTFETAKALRDAGFPQPEFAIRQTWYAYLYPEIWPDGTEFYISNTDAMRFITISEDRLATTGVQDSSRQGEIYGGSVVFAPQAHDILAQLVGCSESYVKHYRICFERANRASNASPIVDFSVN